MQSFCCLTGLWTLPTPHTLVTHWAGQPWAGWTRNKLICPFFCNSPTVHTLYQAGTFHQCYVYMFTWKKNNKYSVISKLTGQFSIRMSSLPCIDHHLAKHWWGRQQLYSAPLETFGIFTPMVHKSHTPPPCHEQHCTPEYFWRCAVWLLSETVCLPPSS